MKKNFFKYLFCNPSYRAWGWYVISAGFSKIEPNLPYPAPGHPDDHHFEWDQGRVLNSFTFVYTPRGRGVFESRHSGSVNISDGTLFILFPGVWHRYRPDPSTGWDEYWIEFAGSAAEHCFEHSTLEPSKPVISINDVSTVMDTYLDIIDLSERQPYGFEYLLSSRAFLLLATVMTEMEFQQNDDKEKAEAIQKARRLLVTDLNHPIDLKQLAADVQMSYSLFRKTFKAVTGFTPHQYRLNFRLHRAEQLLRNSRLQVSQIAYRLGFNSIYYFSELFKKKTGLSPLEFRNAGNANHARTR